MGREEKEKRERGERREKRKERKKKKKKKGRLSRSREEMSFSPKDEVWKETSGNLIIAV